MTQRNNRKLEKLDQYDSDCGDDEYGVPNRKSYEKAIGSFILSFSSFENTLNIKIAELINDRSHVPGYQIIKFLTLKNKLELLRGLFLPSAIHATKKQRADIDKILKRLNELNTFRNRVVHADWTTLEYDGSVRTKIIVDNDGDVLFEKIILTPEIITAEVLGCHHAAMSLDTLIEIQEQANSKVANEPPGEIYIA